MCFLCYAAGVSGPERNWRRSPPPAKVPGYFAGIRPTGDGLPGMPRATGQVSWNIRQTRPVEGRSRVVATWFNDKGEPTEEPAVVASDNCVFMTHVLLDDDRAAKRLLLLAMLGHLDPSLWPQAAKSSFGRLGRIGSYADFEALARGLSESARNNPRALESLVCSQKATGQCRQLGARGQVLGDPGGHRGRSRRCVGSLLFGPAASARRTSGLVVP